MPKNVENIAIGLLCNWCSQCVSSTQGLERSLQNAVADSSDRNSGPASFPYNALRETGVSMCYAL